MTLKSIALSGVAAVLLCACAYADSPTPAGPLPTPKGYVRTGTFESCISANRIQRTQILNEHQILFDMIGKEAYLNEPGSGCSGLNKSLALVWDSTINQLCNSSIVHMVEPSSPVPQRGTCAIQRFEKLTAAPK